ncbi:hypothetical protein ACVBEQ_26630 [Nakamurella sp. GG22]
MVMNWLFGRPQEDQGQRSTPGSTQPAAEPDSPAELAAELFRLNRFINSSAGRLPAPAVVAARRITDTVGAVLHSTRDRDLDIHARVSLNGILRDYLPTTLRTYLALDPAAVDQPARDGRTPTTALEEQLDFLLDSASDVLTAVRDDDANALAAQGSFLRTKFGRSELDF